MDIINTILLILLFYGLPVFLTLFFCRWRKKNKTVRKTCWYVLPVAAGVIAWLIYIWSNIYSGKF